MKKTGFRKQTFQEVVKKQSIKRAKVLEKSKILASNQILSSYTIVSSTYRATPLKRSKLRLAGISDTAILKKDIQEILRAIVILRDGGCFLRNYKALIDPQYVNCGGFRKDGNLILQAEHLHTRSNANSFSNDKIVVCVCQRHHIYYKPQFSSQYNELASVFIGKKNKTLWDIIKNDRTAHKVDLKLAKIVLEQKLKKLLKTEHKNKQSQTENVFEDVYKKFQHLIK